MVLWAKSGEEIKGYELTGERPKKVKGNPPIKGKKKSKKDKLRELEGTVQDSVSTPYSS